MKEFVDQNGCHVKLVFGEQSLFENGAHVWVVCRYEHHWLLTNHRKRGLEFPGGKVEIGESEEDAAKRELFEETGAVAKSFIYIGQYEVNCGETVIQKKIYFTEVDKIKKQSHYYETAGPLLLKELPKKIREDDRFSFIMKDEMLPTVLQEIKRKGLI